MSPRGVRTACPAHAHSGPRSVPGIWSPAFDEHDEVSAALVTDIERNLRDRIICPGVTPQRRCEHPAIDL